MSGKPVYDTAFEQAENAFNEYYKARQRDKNAPRPSNLHPANTTAWEGWRDAWEECVEGAADGEAASRTYDWDYGRE